MASAHAENVIKAIIREITLECAARGNAVSDNLVAFMVKAVLLDPRNEFNVDRTLTKQDVQKLEELCLDKLMEKCSPSLDTMKMQMHFDMNYTTRCESLEEVHRMMESKLNPVRREITDSRVKTWEELDNLYRRIISYILLCSNMGSPTDVNTLQETTAALQSIFPHTELGAFMVLLKRDKEQQLNELSMIVTGIRLLNRASEKGEEETDIHELRIGSALDISKEIVSTSPTVEAQSLSNITSSFSDCDEVIWCVAPSISSDSEMSTKATALTIDESVMMSSATSAIASDKIHGSLVGPSVSGDTTFIRSHGPTYPSASGNSASSTCYSTYLGLFEDEYLSDDPDLQEAISRSLDSGASESDLKMTLERVVELIASRVNDDNTVRFNITRRNVWDGASRAMGRSNFSPEKKIDVKFTDDYGISEGAVDNGGPTREFFRLCLQEVKDNIGIFEGLTSAKFLTCNSKAMKENGYFYAGQIMAMSIAHGGQSPCFLSEVLYECLQKGPDNVKVKTEDVTNEETRLQILQAETDLQLQDAVTQAASLISMAGHNVRITLENKENTALDLAHWYVLQRTRAPFERLRDGLTSLGVLDALQRYPLQMKCLFINAGKALTATDMEGLFQILHSERGSNAFQEECRTLAFWQDYLQDAEVPSALKEVLPVTKKSIEEELQVSQRLAWKYTAVLEKLTDPDSQPAECDLPIGLLKQALYNVRQHEVFLNMLMADAYLCAQHTEILQTELLSQIKLLKETVKSKTAVPTAKVFPLFKALSKLWSGLQDEAELLNILKKITLSLQPYVTSQAQIFSEAYLDSLLEASEVKTDEQRMTGISDEHIVPAEMKTQEWLLPGTAASFNELPLQLNGFCGFTLVNRDGLLLPGNPHIGVFKYKEKFFIFSSKEAAIKFASSSDVYITKVEEKAKHFPELIHLLKLHQQFSCVSAYPEMHPGKSLQVQSTSKCDSGTQTDIHPVETNIVKSYEWNEWELRRKAIKLADLLTKVTHTTQTDLSHMRRENVTQTWLPKNTACQSRRDNESNVPKPQIYLAGLRGQKDRDFVKTNLTRPVDE